MGTFRHDTKISDVLLRINDKVASTVKSSAIYKFKSFWKHFLKIKTQNLVHDLPVDFDTISPEFGLPYKHFWYKFTILPPVCKMIRQK